MPKLKRERQGMASSQWQTLRRHTSEGGRGEIPANRRDSVMKCCWMHELGLTANVLTHLEDGVEGSIPANGRASASMRVRYDCDAPGGAGSGWYASGANRVQACHAH